MDSEEREIFDFLQTWGEEFVNPKEIARRAGGKRKFAKKPDWAKAILVRMHENGVLECDIAGRYRIKPVSKKDKNKRWVSPQIAKILQQGGMRVDEPIEIAPDDYFDKL